MDSTFCYFRAFRITNQNSYFSAIAESRRLRSNGDAANCNGIYESDYRDGDRECNHTEAGY